MVKGLKFVLLLKGLQRWKIHSRSSDTWSAQIRSRGVQNARVLHRIVVQGGELGHCLAVLGKDWRVWAHQVGLACLAVHARGRYPSLWSHCP
jgi:hypothetical protein